MTFSEYIIMYASVSSLCANPNWLLAPALYLHFFSQNNSLKILWNSFRHKETYTWTNPMCCVHNIILGKLWIEQYGTVEIINHRYIYSN